MNRQASVAQKRSCQYCLLLLRQTSILNFPRRCPHTFQFTGYTGQKSRIFTDTADLGTSVTTGEDKIHFCYFHPFTSFYCFPGY